MNPAAEPVDDIGADLKAAMVELGTNDQASTPVAPGSGAATAADPGRTDGPAAPASDAALKSAPIPTDDGRHRGPDGKFVKADGTPVDGVQANAPQIGAEKPKPSVPLLPIPHWSAEIKAEFEGLPDEAKGLILRRERERDAAFTKKSQEIAQLRENYGSVAKAMEPHLQRLRVNGQTPAQAITQLFELEAIANQRPAEFLQWFASTRGVDLKKLVQPADDGQYVDPQLQALQQQLQEERQWRERFQTDYQRQMQEREERVQSERTQSTVSAIVSFAQEADANGASAHPYFEHVQQDMEELIPTMRKRMPNASHRDLLKAAYDAAVWANPETRAHLQSQTASRQAEEKRAVAEQAKARSVSVTGSPGYGGNVDAPVQPPADSIEEELRRAWDAQAGRRL